MVIPLERRTLIIGSGPCAVDIAENLLDLDINIVVATREKKNPALEALKSDQAEILFKARMRDCKGFVGDFNVSIDVDAEKLERTVSNIIIAEEDLRRPKFSDYGLLPTDNVVALTEIVERQETDAGFADIEKVVFVTGLNGDGNPVLTADIMQTCVRMQTDLNISTYILTGNLKVGGNGLEKLYRDTKEAGTVYIKFTEETPDIRQDADGKISILFLDEITREDFRLTPDITVIDEDILPSAYLERLANIFRIDTDRSGFLQTDNVHRLNVLTNRRGITVAGPSRGIQSYAQQMTDAAAAVMATLELFEAGYDGEAVKAEIAPGKCVRCLTCLRVCPHRAIRLNAGVSVVPAACESCGICTAECPKGAISIKGLGSSDILGVPDRLEHNGDIGTFVPVITAFCCSRSAARAWELSSRMGLDLPQGLKVIEIPCGGIVSLDYIFAAFRADADGVLIMTCHEENCNSERGNVYARNRVDSIAGLLSQMGFEKDRLKVISLASNMGREFSDITQDFEKRIKDLGPSKLKKA